MFYNKAIRFNISNEKIKSWRKNYDQLLKKALLNTKGSQIIVKNPCNTGRIKQLLKMYPNAKFVHIYRNPITVYLSTKKFFTELFPSVQLQQINNDLIEELIIQVYKNLYYDYFSQVSKIPKNQLYELKFEDFEKKPIYFLEDIYNHLKINGFKDSKILFDKYFKKNKKYKKNTYSISKDEVNKIRKEWGFVFENFNYSNPKNIEIL